MKLQITNHKSQISFIDQKILETLPTGAHILYFYKTSEDLFEVLFPYFNIGLEKNEVCLWTVSESVIVQEAKEALIKEVPAFKEKEERGEIRLVNCGEWSLKEGFFDHEQILKKWKIEKKDALNKGFEGLRVCGDGFCLMKMNKSALKEYEETVAEFSHEHKSAALCAYQTGQLNLNDVIDLVNSHPCTLVKRDQTWNIVENSALKAKKDIKQELENKIDELQRFKNLAIGRELKMIELKKKIKEMEEKLTKVRYERKNK